MKNKKLVMRIDMDKGVVFKKKTTETHTIDIEPKWINLIDLFVEWLGYGTKEQKELSIEELKKMAICCDLVRQYQKREITTLEFLKAIPKNPTY